MWNENPTDKLVSQTLQEVSRKPNRQSRSLAKERGFWKGPFASDSKRSRSGRSTTPKRLSSTYAAKRGWDQNSGTTSTQSNGSPTSQKGLHNFQHDITSVNPLEAVCCTLRTLNTTVSDSFVRNLLCMLGDQFSSSETVAGCNSFLQLESNRKNKLTVPPEGWFEVRRIVISDHGSLRGAFANMCRGRRGGVMTGSELKKDFQRLGLSHCVPHIVRAIDPDERDDENICIGLEEFVWILNGGRDCDDIMSSATSPHYSSPNRLDKTHSEEFGSDSPKQNIDRMNTLEQRLSSLEQSPLPVSDDLTEIKRRVAQLEISPLTQTHTKTNDSDEVLSLRNKISELERMVKKESKSPRVVSPRGSPVLAKDGSFSYQKSMTRGCSPGRVRYGNPPSTKSYVASPLSSSMRSPPRSIPPSVPYIIPPHEAKVEVPSPRARRSRSSPSISPRSPSFASPGVLRSSFSPKNASFVKTFSPVPRHSSSEDDDSTVLSDTEIKFLDQPKIPNKGNVPQAPNVEKQI